MEWGASRWFSVCIPAVASYLEYKYERDMNQTLRVFPWMFYSSQGLDRWCLSLTFFLSVSCRTLLALWLLVSMTPTPAPSSCPGYAPLTGTPHFSTTCWSSLRTVRVCVCMFVCVWAYFIVPEQQTSVHLLSTRHWHTLIYKRQTYGEWCCCVNVHPGSL